MIKKTKEKKKQFLHHIWWSLNFWIKTFDFKVSSTRTRLVQYCTCTYKLYYKYIKVRTSTFEWYRKDGVCNSYYACLSSCIHEDISSSIVHTRGMFSSYQRLLPGWISIPLFLVCVFKLINEWTIHMLMKRTQELEWRYEKDSFRLYLRLFMDLHFK